MVLSRQTDDDDDIIRQRDELVRDFSARVIFLDNDPLPVSSSEIRAHPELAGKVDPAVYEYMKKNGLYYFAESSLR